MQSAYQQTQLQNLQKQLNSLANLYQQQASASLQAPYLMASAPSGYPMKASAMGFSTLVSASTIAGPLTQPTQIFASAFGVSRAEEEEMSIKERNAAALRKFLKEAGL